MKLKSYFSSTVEAALELARKELGGEALLVNARPATPETRYLGAYEVVFGLLPSPPEQVIVPPSNDDSVRVELAELRRQIDRLSTAPAAQLSPGPPAAQPLKTFRVDAALGRVVALVGPPGVGKTTTLIKLAAHCGLARRKCTQLLTTDVFRIAATDQLRILAAILGLPCEIADTPLVLNQLLETHASKDLVLIDTPGFSFREMEDAAELAVLLASQPTIDTHLVLSASMKPADMTRVLDSYAVFRPSKLIFTRVDETDSYEALANEAANRSLPISFLCTGQRIPDDLEEASVSRLADLVFGSERVLRMGASA